MKRFPLQILNLCRTLLRNRGNEGIYRTIISRSYYAALLYSALWIDKNHRKVDWDQKHLHQMVPSLIGQWLPEPWNKEIPSAIHSLRKRRENADYQPAFNIKKNYAKQAFEEAKTIIAVLQKL